MRATFIRSAVLSIDDYRDLSIRAANERSMSRLMATDCDSYSIEWQKAILYDPDTKKFTRGWRIVGKGEGKVP